MPQARHRPKVFPPPEFPPRRPKPFARMAPAVFPALLGACGLQIALAAALDRLGLPRGAADLLAGLVLPLWAFAVLAYAVKIARRPAVLAEEMRVMPARAALSALTMGGMAVATILARHAPGAAFGLLLVALLAHALIAVMVLRTLWQLPAEARSLDPGWHMNFVGFLVGGPAAALLGAPALAQMILFLALPVAIAIWAGSLWQLRHRIPPAPLRPMLAIHLAPASLISSTATLTGHDALAVAAGIVALTILAALLLSGRWIVAAGFSPLWAAFTFPLTAAATSLIRLGGDWQTAGLCLTALALVVVPLIAWRVLKDWPGGRLAARTNAAEA